MESLSDELNINRTLDVQKNQNIIKIREYRKIKDAKYGGKCVEPTGGDMTTTCENECPVNCIGIFEKYGSPSTSKCPSGEDARNKYMKQKLRYRVITPGSGNRCVDTLYGTGEVIDGKVIEIDSDMLCPIDGVADKQYSECNIFDDCGPMKEDGTYDIEHALEKQVKRRIIWKEIVKPQGQGAKHTNLPQLNEQLESCNPVKKCPIQCVYK